LRAITKTLTEGGHEVTQLNSLRLLGWQSVRDAKIDFRPLNVLIGANGAGKSNLVSFFKMVTEMMEGRFQIHVGTTGGAEALLHYGSKRTQVIVANFRFTAEKEADDFYYYFSLVPTAENSLLFEDEKLGPSEGFLNEAFHRKLGYGHRENLLKDRTIDSEYPMAMFIRGLLTRCRVFHFHDTSLLGPVRRDCPVDANRSLASDAANLPAMLYLYQERYPTAYRRIIAAVKAIAPFFEDFVLEPLRLNPRNISLHWRSKESDYEFGAHQLSDGTLRAIALFTLLLQPEEDLPELIVLDEPELGLHPAALAVLADLLKSTSQHSQLIIATQSAALIDHFEVEDVVTVNLRDGCSTFERLDPAGLKHWLEEYTLSELWERNVIGGGPF
jgi:predicted ATPase